MSVKMRLFVIITILTVANTVMLAITLAILENHDKIIRAIRRDTAKEPL